MADDDILKKLRDIAYTYGKPPASSTGGGNEAIRELIRSPRYLLDFRAEETGLSRILTVVTESPIGRALGLAGKFTKATGALAIAAVVAGPAIDYFTEYRAKGELATQALAKGQLSQQTYDEYMRLMKFQVGSKVDFTGVFGDGIMAGQFEDFATKHAKELARTPGLRDALAPESLFGRTKAQRDFAAFYEMLPADAKPGMSPAIEHLARLKGQIGLEKFETRVPVSLLPMPGVLNIQNATRDHITELEKNFAEYYGQHKTEVDAWMRANTHTPAPGETIKIDLPKPKQ